jgi:hypothetical protein
VSRERRTPTWTWRTGNTVRAMALSTGKFVLGRAASVMIVIVAVTSTCFLR